MTEAVVLTGATGFVGRAVLADLVAQGIPVHAISRRPGALQDGVVWHKADLLTAEGRAAVAGLAPCMIHCAWEVEHGVFWTSPANALWQAASVDLARRFREAGGQRLLATGTCAEYDAEHLGPWDENRPIAPTTPYGQAKASLHRDLAAVYDQDLVWARLFYLHGPGEDRRRLIPSLINAFREGRPAEVRSADLIRDYATTAHVARCLVSLMQQNASGAFDIGSGHAMGLGEIACLLATKFGRPELLRLGHVAGNNEPAKVAPSLARLREVLGTVEEDFAVQLMAL